MTLLQIMPEDAPQTVTVQSDDLDVIRKELLRIGVRFARWHAARRLPADADDSTIMNAYRSHIDHVSAEGSHRVVDIARMTPASADPDQPQHQEHVHEEDLVRFVVAGAGCFYLHVASQVHAILCTAGDLLCIPSRTMHWFDAGTRPNYTAIRFFQEDNGCAARFLPDSIAARFPAFDDLTATP
ncbi:MULTISPECIES: cupin [unclassified Streptomyces]|uniref:cupin n=1 Tax=unclassified Streptomyces TaxID=2593676 RepID=UPI002E1F5DFE|nr:cupin [Streptomyces sp. NBC_01023]